MLSASAHGLSACPSAAINHSLVAEKLGHTGEPAKAAIYALTLGYPDPETDAKTEGDDVFMVT
jgi:nitroreductase